MKGIDYKSRFLVEGWNFRNEILIFLVILVYKVGSVESKVCKLGLFRMNIKVR